MAKSTDDDHGNDDKPKRPDVGEYFRHVKESKDPPTQLPER